MTYIYDILTNPVFVSAALSWLVAQGLKILFSMIKNGFSAERLTGSGGMPSSHSATVIGLLTGTILNYGFNGFEFPIALFFAIIVIYDAMGVRMETGREAHVLNRLMERDQSEGRKPVQEKELNEMMGHTLPEIIAGIVIGIICGCIVQFVLNYLHFL